LVLKKAANGGGDGVDLVLRQDVVVVLRPVAVPERRRGHAVLVHVLDDGDETGDAGRAAAHGEADEAVLARPDLLLDRVADAVEVAGALAAVALHPRLRRMRHVRHQHQLLQRDIDVLTAAGPIALPERGEDAARRFGAAVIVGHRHRAAHRRAVGVAGHEQVAAGSEHRQIRPR
jgi:hypothetical protein